MSNGELKKSERNLITTLVDHYKKNEELFTLFIDQLVPLFMKSSTLKPLIHSVKWRIKNPTHLKEKLLRKLVESKRERINFDIQTSNLFEKINDLAGIRLLHLHTYQFEELNLKLLEILNNEYYTVLEGPIASTWDDEYRDYFNKINVPHRISPNMYTSVHYIIQPKSKSLITGEIQVRTLAEELWGEVDHAINYPNSSKILACREQIKVLARVTSSCTRLVDSIFLAHNEKNVKNKPSK